MACCLTAPIHYLSQCWLLVSEVPWHSLKDNFTVCTQATILYNEFDMMMSSNGNIFIVTGPLCGEFTGHLWIPRTKASAWRGALMFSLICAQINGWVNNGEAGDLRWDGANYDVTVMKIILWKLLPHFPITLWPFVTRHDRFCSFISAWKT